MTPAPPSESAKDVLPSCVELPITRDDPRLLVSIGKQAEAALGESSAFAEGAEAMRKACLQAITPEAQSADDRRDTDPTGYMSGIWQGLRRSCALIRSINTAALASHSAPAGSGEEGT